MFALHYAVIDLELDGICCHHLYDESDTTYAFASYANDREQTSGTEHDGESEIGQAIGGRSLLKIPNDVMTLDETFLAASSKNRLSESAVGRKCEPLLYSDSRCKRERHIFALRRGEMMSSLPD